MSVLQSRHCGISIIRIIRQGLYIRVAIRSSRRACNKKPVAFALKLKIYERPVLPQSPFSFSWFACFETPAALFEFYIPFLFAKMSTSLGLTDKWW